MKVKICGLTRPEDARLAAQLGAHYLGVVLAPDSPRRMTPEEAAVLGRAGRRPLVLVVVDPDPEEVVAAAIESGARAIQFHGSEPPELLSQVAAGGDWKVWKAFRVKEAGELPGEVERYGKVADAMLLDGWHPRAHGGTGEAFDWEAVAALRRMLPSQLPLILAGGLDAGNVAQAIRILKPDGVDVSSGVEASPGVKDPEKMAQFITASGAPEVPTLIQGG
ncbi:MAG: phosphoribosylanthranilate isomerase [Gemmatimonadota bacterium]